MGAARVLAEEVANGIITVAEINEDLVKSRMTSSMLPKIDLLIRTGGEYRISNFMLWDLSMRSFISRLSTGRISRLLILAGRSMITVRASGVLAVMRLAR